MFTWKAIVKLMVLIAISLVVGIFEMSCFFSDLGPGETNLERFATAGIVLFVAGLIIGYLYPERWFLSGIPTWRLILLGMMSLASSPPKPSDIPEGAQVLRIVVSEGRINIDPASIKTTSEKLYIVEINEGIETHQLAVFAGTQDDFCYSKRI